MMINNNNKKNENNNKYINHDDEDDDEYGHDTRAQREAQRPTLVYYSGSCARNTLFQARTHRQAPHVTAAAATRH